MTRAAAVSTARCTVEVPALPTMLTVAISSEIGAVGPRPAASKRWVPADAESGTATVAENAPSRSATALPTTTGDEWNEMVIDAPAAKPAPVNVTRSPLRSVCRTGDDPRPRRQAGVSGQLGGG